MALIDLRPLRSHFELTAIAVLRLSNHTYFSLSLFILHNTTGDFALNLLLTHTGISVSIEKNSYSSSSGARTYTHKYLQAGLHC